MSFDGNDDPSSAQPVPNHSELEVGAKPKPVSARKLAANRANAARSTGPRTAEGKARVAMNALRHGLASHAPLLPGEEPAELDALATAYQNDAAARGAGAGTRRARCRDRLAASASGAGGRGDVGGAARGSDPQRADECRAVGGVQTPEDALAN